MCVRRRTIEVRGGKLRRGRDMGIVNWKSPEGGTASGGSKKQGVNPSNGADDCWAPCCELVDFRGKFLYAAGGVQAPNGIFPADPDSEDFFGSKAEVKPLRRNAPTSFIRGEVRGRLRPSSGSPPPSVAAGTREISGAASGKRASRKPKTDNQIL